MELVQNDLEEDWEDLDHGQRLERAGTVLHGRLCLGSGEWEVRLRGIYLTRRYAEDEAGGGRVGRMRVRTMGKDRVTHDPEHPLLAAREYSETAIAEAMSTLPPALLGRLPTAEDDIIDCATKDGLLSRLDALAWRMGRLTLEIGLPPDSDGMDLD